MSSSNRIDWWSPDVTYRFDIVIGGKSYNNELYRIRIRSSIDIPYQSVDLFFSMNVADAIKEKIFGQEPLKLTITMLGFEGKSEESIKMDLMFLSSESNLTSTETDPEQGQKDLDAFFIPTVCRAAYKTMLTAVNEVYPNDSLRDTRVVRVAYDLIKKAGGIPNVDFDSQNVNNTLLDQLVVPPNTLFNSIAYLDKTYGIYNGPMAFWCSFDNRVNLINLNKSINSSEQFSLYFLSSTGDNSKYFTSNDPKLYYTSKDILANYRGNAVMSYFAPTTRFIVKPRNELFNIIQCNMESLGKDNSIMSNKSSEIIYDKFGLGDQRISFYPDYTGYDKSDSFIKAGMGRALSEIATLSVNLEYKLPVLNLTEVGKSVNFESVSGAYKDFNGKYILKASEVQFIRIKTWESKATIYLIRTNRVDKIVANKQSATSPSTENFGAAPISVPTPEISEARFLDRVKNSENTVNQIKNLTETTYIDKALEATKGNFAEAAKAGVKSGGLTQTPEQVAAVKSIAGNPKEISQTKIDYEKNIENMENSNTFTETQDFESIIEKINKQRNVSGIDEG
jgi:hypothetical protein